MTIEFPDEIRVLDLADVKKLEEPEGPKKPRDLQEIAYERAHKSEVAMFKTLAQLNQLGSVQPFHWPDLSAYAVRNTVFESVDICDNTVNIELKDGIVHTKWDSFRDIYIVPLMQGEFKAKVTLMCAAEITFVCE